MIRKTLLATALLFTNALLPVIHAQTPGPARPAQSPDDVIRINTDLVQTEVMVFDSRGRFVDGLRPDQFEVTLSGARQPVSFFERITSGSATEAIQITAARRPGADINKPKKSEATRSADNGRVIFFFVDDLHLSSASLIRARKTLQSFVDNQMNAYDQVAIVSSSGQVGFLQQLTDNPVVLNTAIARLNYKQDPEAHTGKTQISDYMASQVLDYGNREFYAYLLESVKVEQQMSPGSRHGDHQLAASYSAAPYLRNRMRQINAQGWMKTADTLSVLESLMNSSAALPGRKLVFFLSDGFIVNERKSGALEALHRLTRAANRSGVVVYTMDLRHSANLGSGTDASTNAYIDLSGRRTGFFLGELTATQEPLKLIADQTGGRAILNTAGISEGILAAIRETADYYLLAWRPEVPFTGVEGQQISVTIKDPELQVRFRNNLYTPTVSPVSNGTPAEKQKQKTETNAKPVDETLLTTLSALYPDRSLPVLLSVGYLKTDAPDLTMKLSMQISRRNLELDKGANFKKTEVDVVGVALDDRGQFASFKQLLTVPRESAGEKLAVVWSQQLQLKPGLYQVRVAIKERSTGRTGSASQWIQLPDTGTAHFGLSSLFLGERKEDATVGSAAGPQPISVDVDHRFARASALRFQTYVYNPARGESGPDVEIQTQVFRNRQQVMSVVSGKVPVTSTGSRLPYWSEIALSSLSPGPYVLQVTATDRTSNRTASQRVNFSVE